MHEWSMYIRDGGREIDLGKVDIYIDIYILF